MRLIDFNNDPNPFVFLNRFGHKKFIHTPDIYDHGSLSLLIHGLCIQAIYDPLPCALPGQLIIDRNLTPQTSPRYTLVTSLVKSQSWQIIW